MSVVRNSFLAGLTLALVSACAYAWPRFLAFYFGEDSPWISWLYTYGMGAIFFFLSAVYIFSKKGINPLRRKQELYWLTAVTSGLLFMFLLHGFWIVLAVYSPIKN